MAQFDKSKVFTSVNAEELKIGSKVICANTIGCLKNYVERDVVTDILRKVECADYQYRFITDENEYALAYLVKEPEEKGLKVADLKIGDVIKPKINNIRYSITGIDYDDKCVFFGGDWADENEIVNWEKVE